MTGIFGLKWKLGAIAASVLLVVAAGFLFVIQVENRHLLAENAKLDARINDKTNGYVVQLAQAATNVKQLETALDSQNQRLRQQAATSSAELATLTAQVAEVQRENAKLRAAAAHILNGAPRGSTAAERINDIDRRILETLK